MHMMTKNDPDHSRSRNKKSSENVVQNIDFDWNSLYVRISHVVHQRPGHVCSCSVVGRFTSRFGATVRGDWIHIWVETVWILLSGEKWEKDKVWGWKLYQWRFLEFSQRMTQHRKSRETDREKQWSGWNHSHEESLKEHQDPRLTQYQRLHRQRFFHQSWHKTKPSLNTPGGKHNLFAYFPKDPNCEVCRQTKITRAPGKINPEHGADRLQRAEKFGDIIAVDHKILNEENESRLQHWYSVVVQVWATRWIQSYPCKSKSAQETMSSLRRFQRPEQDFIVIYADNSLEWMKSCADLNWNHDKSTPHTKSENQRYRWTSRPQSKRRDLSTGGAIWSAQKLVERGYGMLLLSEGTFTICRQMGKTLCERRLGTSCKRPVIPCGAAIAYHPISSKDKSRLRQYGPKVVRGLFIGYAFFLREEVGLEICW